MAREMKDSGIEWIGEIPREWNLERLKWILRERKEKNDPQRTDFILSLGISYGVIPYSEKEGGGNKAKESLTDYRLAYDNDIVMNSMNIISGSVGISKYFGCVSPVYYVLYPWNNTVSSKYYCFLFQTTAFQRSLLGLGNGILIKESSSGKFNTVRMRIPMDKLGLQILPLPSVSEQNRIVDFLDTQCSHIDSVIEKTHTAIGEYKKLKQFVITQAVTKGIRPNREMKDSQTGYIGEIPIDWKVIRIRYLGTCQNGISKGGEFFGSGFPFVSYSDVYKNIELPLHVDKLVESTEEEQERYSVKEGDIFFTRTSETVEEVGFSSVCRNTIENATFAGFLIRVRPYTQKVLTGFSKYYFRSDIHREYFVKEMNLVTRASLGQELLKSMPVLIPSISEQSEIVAYLDEKTAAIDSLIQKKEQLISELEVYKKSLIYEYVTGKKEVPHSKPRIKYTIEFKMALLMCRILQYTNIEGRVHMQKVIYSSDTLLNLFNEIQYYRFQKGPYDINIERYEHSLVQHGWVKVYKKRGKVIYKKTSDFNKYTSFYKNVFSEMDLEIKRICQLFNVLSTAQAGKTATVVASWNDFLIDGVTPTDEMIVNDIVTNWTANKANIPRKTWFDTLEQIKSKGLVPKGFGKKTLHLEEAKHAH